MPANKDIYLSSLHRPNKLFVFPWFLRGSSPPELCVESRQRAVLGQTQGCKFECSVRTYVNLSSFVWNCGFLTKFGLQALFQFPRRQDSRHCVLLPWKTMLPAEANVNKPFTFFKGFIYLLLERRRGGRKTGRETSVCGCFSCAPYWRPGLQPRHVP